MEKQIEKTNAQNEGIRSKRLFHYTKDYATLQEIIDKGLRCSLLYEKIPYSEVSKDKLAYQVRCACLCDIPLSKVGSHVSTYGRYAIGLKSRSIGEKTAVPVFYSNEEISGLSTKDEQQVFYRTYSDITRRLKKVHGKFQRKRDEKKAPSIDFIRECEWRFFPDNAKVDILWYRTEKEIFDYTDDIKAKTKYKKSDYIPIDIDKDVEYIILGNHDDYKLLLSYLKQHKKYKSLLEIILPKVLLYDRLRFDL